MGMDSELMSLLPGISNHWPDLKPLVWACRIQPKWSSGHAIVSVLALAVAVMLVAFVAV